MGVTFGKQHFTTKNIMILLFGAIIGIIFWEYWNKNTVIQQGRQATTGTYEIPTTQYQDYIEQDY
jgi:predicted negative regulator of RcsB-dependent stress response